LNTVYYPLRIAYGLVPFLAGLDKFVGILANWEQYLPEFVVPLLPISPAGLMMVVGCIEMAAGLAVLTVLPRLGAYVVMVWLVLIALLLVPAGYLDVAVRDLVMAVGAYTLGRIAGIRGEHWFGGATADATA
ncbi:DoxX family membrane protein, partial [Roseimaritima sediminicola]|uniref:DoxX family membrane protein n=1 Tax=Roseimaritima sediminicola TaxID=2662066 RepID=UPI00192A305F